MKILFVEDDQAIALGLVYSLEKKAMRSYIAFLKKPPWVCWKHKYLTYCYWMSVCRMAMVIPYVNKPSIYMMYLLFFNCFR